MVTKQFLYESSQSVIKSMKDIGVGIRSVEPGGEHFPTPALIQLYFAPEKNIPVKSILNAAPQIRLAVKRADATVTQGDDRIIVEFPHGQPQKVVLEEMLGITRPPYVALCGRDVRGNPFGFNFIDPNSYHALVVGSTGSGKTVLAHSMVMSLCQRHPVGELFVLVINPKVKEEPWFYNAVGKNMVKELSTARTTQEAIHQLKTAVAAMDQFKRRGHVLIYVEELADLAMSEGGQEAIALLNRIAQRGGEQGIHLLICTQKPKAALMNSFLLNNVPTRLVGRLATATDSANVCGPGVGAHLLRGGGDFYKIAAGGRITRFQAAIPTGYTSGSASIDEMEESYETLTPAPIALPAANDAEQTSVAEGDDKLIKAQAAAVYWYRRANPKTAYTKTELARVLWPGMKTLAGGYSSRIEAVIAQADRIPAENLPT